MRVPFKSRPSSADGLEMLQSEVYWLSAFTLIELLCVITIIAILASLLMPAIRTMTARANSIQCSSNLHTIGTAVQLYLQDHSQNFPAINPAEPPLIYTDPSTPAVTMLQAFSPYGVGEKTLQCPTDIKLGNASAYHQYNSSYDWKPTLDDENKTEPLVYFHRRNMATTSGTTGFLVSLARVRQVFDDTPLHFGHMNALYADGHVVYFTQ